MNERSVQKPVRRSPLRRALGREYYIFKRRLRWLAGSGKYVPRPGSSGAGGITPYVISSHRSMMLRPLKDVDMRLQHNKVTNLRPAAMKMDGVVIKPGQRFSVWRMVGRPTKRKGYLKGLAIHNGQIGESTGGCLFQMGNLLYWMTLHTDLDITERWRHSFDVFPDVNRTIPFACGATLGYNYLDLEITNNTANTYSLRLWQDDEYLYGEILSDAPADYEIEVFETDHRIEQQWWGGYTRHNRIWKRRTPHGGEPVETLVSENHAMMRYNPLLPE